MCQIRILKLGARTRLLCWFSGGSDDTDLLPLDQVCWHAGYDRTIGAVGLAVLSGLGRRYTHPGRWIRGFVCPFVAIDPTD